jgi:hypothetical protein
MLGGTAVFLALPLKLNLAAGKHPLASHNYHKSIIMIHKPWRDAVDLTGGESSRDGTRCLYSRRKLKLVMEKHVFKTVSPDSRWGLRPWFSEACNPWMALQPGTEARFLQWVAMQKEGWSCCSHECASIITSAVFFTARLSAAAREHVAMISHRCDEGKGWLVGQAGRASGSAGDYYGLSVPFQCRFPAAPPNARRKIVSCNQSRRQTPLLPWFPTPTQGVLQTLIGPFHF